MSGRDKKDEAPTREGNQGICVKCRRLLPVSAFMRDDTGNLSGWCNVCREEVAKNWGVELHMVEWIRALYVFEQGMKKEAEQIMKARVAMGQATEAELAAMRNRIHQYNTIRHSRLRERMREAAETHRQAFFAGIGMPVPEVAPLAIAAA